MVFTGDVRLTYFGKWDYITRSIKDEAVKKLYVAPGESCDSHVSHVIVM